jgi:hypothetical protein
MANKEFQLPIKGESQGLPVEDQPPLTSGHMQNVIALDTLERRVRIGKRPGLKKWGAPTQIGAAEQPVVSMAVVASIF